VEVFESHPLRTIFYPYRPHRHPDRFADGTQRKRVRHRAATHGATCESCALEISSFNCGHDAPDPCVIEGIVEQSGTHYFSVKDLDENRSTGSVKIRVETIACFLRYSRRSHSAKGRRNRTSRRNSRRSKCKCAQNSLKRRKAAVSGGLGSRASGTGGRLIVATISSLLANLRRVRMASSPRIDLVHFLS
jgi:hypothetical protein